jgi:hypothetical protein
MNIDSQTGTAADEICDECGRFGASEIGGHKLCAECVTLAGSACAGSASDDAD